MATNAWILQVTGNNPKHTKQFQLEPALKEAPTRDRKLWLAPERTVRFDGPEHPVEGDRVYLNVSGEKPKGSSRSGRLVAIATAMDKPDPQRMPEWQETHFTEFGKKSYKTNDERVHLHIDALIDPALKKQEVYDADPAVRDRPCFYQLKGGKNVARGTTFFVDKALDDLLFSLCERRLTNIEPTSLTLLNQIPLSEEDARKRVIRKVNERSGQGPFRQALLCESDACAFTGTRVKEALEAAHIKPYRGKQTNDPDNGLLLRADVHTLFDCGLLRIDPANGQLQINATLEGLRLSRLGWQTRMQLGAAQTGCSEVAMGQPRFDGMGPPRKTDTCNRIAQICRASQRTLCDTTGKGRRTTGICDRVTSGSIFQPLRA